MLMERQKADESLPHLVTRLPDPSDTRQMPPYHSCYILSKETMATFTITPTTTVNDLEHSFTQATEGTLRIYDGRSVANPNEKLVALGAKTGTLECRTSRTVGSFEKAFQEQFGLRVKVYTRDNHGRVLPDITLATVKEIPRQARQVDMQPFVSNYANAGKKVQKPAEDETANTAEALPDTTDCALLDFDDAFLSEVKDQYSVVVVTMMQSEAHNLETYVAESKKLWDYYNECGVTGVIYRDGKWYLLPEVEYGEDYEGDTPEEFQNVDFNGKIYFIVDSVGSLGDLASAAEAEPGEYLSESVADYYGGSSYPEDDNNINWVLGEKLTQETGGHSRHVYPGVGFDADHYYVCNGKVIASFS